MVTSENLDRLIVLATPDSLGSQKYLSLMLNRLILKISKFQLSPLKEVSLLAILTKNISSNFFSWVFVKYVSTIPEEKLHVTDLWKIDIL